MRCPYCKSEHVVKMGFNRNVRKVNGVLVVAEIKQRYVCYDCRKTTVHPIDNAPKDI